MIVKFNYQGTEVDFYMEDHPDIEVNPIPVLEGILKVYQAIGFGYGKTSLTIKTGDSSEI
jgi:hypothetical protein